MKTFLLALTLSIFLFSKAQSSNDFKKLHKIIETSETIIAKKAIWDFVEQFQLETTLAKLADGNYIGVSPKDDYDYVHKLWLTIKDGRVVKVNYDEVKKVKNVEIGKKIDSLYCQKMLATIGTSPADAYKKYENQLITRQDVSRIDAMSGATYSLYRFQLAFFDILVNKTTE